MTDDEVYVLNADKDPVPAAGWFAKDFGGYTGMIDGVTDGETGDATNPLTGQRLTGVEGHVDYMRDSSTSQHNIASVIAA